MPMFWGCPELRFMAMDSLAEAPVGSPGIELKVVMALFS